MLSGGDGQLEEEEGRPAPPIGSPRRRATLFSLPRAWADVDEIICLSVLISVILVHVVHFHRLSLRLHYGLHSSAYDLGLWDQGLWLMSRFQDPYSTVMQVPLLGDHLTFFLYLLVPLYWLWPSVDALLLAQTVALGVGALGAYLLGRDMLGRSWPALLVSISYLWHPAIQWTNLDQFHPDAFEVPLVFFALFAMRRRSWYAFGALLVALLMIKEDVALLVIPLGVYVFFRYSRRVGAIVVAGGLTWLLASVYVLLPLINDLGSYDLDRLPFDGPRGILEKAFTAPWELGGHLLTAAKQKYLFQLVVPLALLPLLSPLTVLAAGPLLMNLLSTHTYQSEIGWHYSTLIVPVLVFATFGALRRAVPWAGGRAREVQVGLAIVVLAATIGSAYLWGPLPWSQNPRQMPDPDAPRAVAVREAAALIPADASISAYHWFVPHVSQRKEVYFFPNPWFGTYLQDLSKERLRLPEADTVEYLLIEPGILTEEERVVFAEVIPEFDLVYEKDGIQVLRRR